MTTNYEKIKNMTVEELAEFFHKTNACFYCIYEGLEETECDESEGCLSGIKQWLQAEAEG